MKKLLIILIALLPVLASAQSLDRQVIASAGDFASAGNVQLSWTLGEVAVTTGSSGNLVITQGFQQADGMAVGIQSPVNDFSAMLFPNPTQDVVILSLSSKEVQEVHMQWMNMLGQDIGQGETVTINRETSREYDLSSYAAGTYFLVLRDEQGRFIKSFKVQKLN